MVTRNSSGSRQSAGKVGLGRGSRKSSAKKKHDRAEKRAARRKKAALGAQSKPRNGKDRRVAANPSDLKKPWSVGRLDGRGPPAASFYFTKGWRDLRRYALKMFGSKCMKCDFDNPVKSAHIDHIHARSRRPSLRLTLTNVQVLCAECNSDKGAESADYRSPAQRELAVEMSAPEVLSASDIQRLEAPERARRGAGRPTRVVPRAQLLPPPKIYDDSTPESLARQRLLIRDLLARSS